jgi:hypothetical protein
LVTFCVSISTRTDGLPISKRSAALFQISLEQRCSHYRQDTYGTIRTKPLGLPSWLHQNHAEGNSRGSVTLCWQDGTKYQMKSLAFIIESGDQFRKDDRQPMMLVSVWYVLFFARSCRLAENLGYLCDLYKLAQFGLWFPHAGAKKKKSALPPPRLSVLGWRAENAIQGARTV